MTWRFTPSQLEISRSFEFSSAVKGDLGVADEYQIASGSHAAVWLTAYVGPLRVRIQQPIHLLGRKPQPAAHSKRPRTGSLTLDSCE